MSTSDLAMARRILNGDEAAFEEFFERSFPRLFRFALPRLGGNGTLRRRSRSVC